MSKGSIIELVVIAIFIVVGIVLFRKDKGLFHKLLGSFVYGLMLQAETYLKSKKGEEKLKMVLDLYEEKLNSLPAISRMVMKAFLPKEKVKTLIEKFLPTLNDIVRPLYEAEHSSIKEIAKKVKDEFVEKALDVDLNGNKNLISNEQLIDLSDDYNLSIEDRGFIKGYAKIQSDFHKTNVEAGIAGVYKF